MSRNTFLVLVFCVLVVFAVVKFKKAGEWNKFVLKLQGAGQNIQAEKPEIRVLEKQLAADEAKLMELKQQMDQYRQAGNVTAHNQALAELNRLQDVYDSHFRNYKVQVETHNAKVRRLKSVT